MKKIFVVSSIGEEKSKIREKADMVLEYIIKPAAKELGYEAIRADEEIKSNLITKSVIRNVIEADLVIADITNHNPNVFYELAIRHTIGKPVIQIMEEDEKIPFDVSHQRTISYTLDLKGAEKAKNTLIEFIKASETEKVENPVLDVLSLSNISNVKSDDVDLNNALQELTNEIKRIPEYLMETENRIAGRLVQVKETQPLRPDLLEGMSTEEKMGMMMMEKMFSNPKTSGQLLEIIFNNKK